MNRTEIIDAMNRVAYFEQENPYPSPPTGTPTAGPTIEEHQAWTAALSTRLAAWSQADQGLRRAHAQAVQWAVSFGDDDPPAAMAWAAIARELRGVMELATEKPS